jgi:hypothetical protein
MPNETPKTVQLQDRLLEEVTNFYLQSRRFNGLPIRGLENRLSTDRDSIKAALKQLISAGFISIVYGDYHPNPHIRAMDDEPIESQIEKIDTEKYLYGCAYPLPAHLEKVVDRSQYHDKPFTLELALGAPQLSFRFFDLSVLENYRNDPRYYYRCDDINGQISITDEYYESENMPERDQVLLETFGFGYDKNLNRGVTSLLWYISCLSPEHQRIWKAKELHCNYQPHPEYYRNNIIGDFAEKIIIFEAFLMEMRLINQACDAIGWPNLFKTDFHENKPRELAFLLRPTEKEYYAFVHTLDKMLSENINRDFFRGMSTEEEIPRADGKIEVRQKGTIRLLSEWIVENFKPPGQKDIELQTEAIQSLKTIRSERTTPGHRIIEDKFDQQFIHKQRELMDGAYMAVRVLRSMLMNHPLARNIEVSEYLEKGLICSY